MWTVDGDGFNGVSVGSEGDFGSTVTWHENVCQVFLIQNKLRFKGLRRSIAPWAPTLMVFL